MRIIEHLTYRECRSAIEGTLWTEDNPEHRTVDPIHFTRAFVYPCRETRDLMEKAAREEEAARDKAHLAADLRFFEDGRSIFSRTPFGPRMSLKNYRVKPASKAWIEANRI